MPTGVYERPDATTRFFRFVRFNPETGCWEWLGAKGSGGYAVFWDGNRITTGHAFAHQVMLGETDYGLQLDHLCRNRGCVNPAHLEPVTQAENLRRGINHQTLKTHCPHGHEYTPENTLYHNGGRACKACHSARRRRTKSTL